MRSRSSAVRYPHQAGEAYVSRASIVARATSCRAEAGMPRDCRVFRAYMDDEHDPRILLTWAETDSVSVTVMLSILVNGDIFLRRQHFSELAPTYYSDPRKKLDIDL